MRCEETALCNAAFRVAALWCTKTKNLGGRCEYFLFFLLGGGKGGVRGNWEGGEVGFLLKILGGAGPRTGEGQGGREGVCRKLGGGG